MNILAIGAHPDDIEFGCAPVLIKEAKHGSKVHLLVLSRGEAGSRGTPEQREQESQKAAGQIGATIDFLDVGGDCRIEYTRDNSIKIAAEIRKFAPAIVLAPHPSESQHPDHAVAGRLSRDACRLARYGGLEPLKPAPAHPVANLYYYHITRHGVSRPDLVLDISDVASEWEAVMNCHASQVAYKSYIDLQKTAARLLGLTIGTGYAAGLYVDEPVRLERISDLKLSARNF